MNNFQNLEAALLRGSYNNSENISFSGGFYSPNKAFYLYVGVEGNVTAITVNGQQFTRFFTVGYHPIALIQVVQAGTTATDLGACW
jgi:hypothetical protein